MSEQENKRPCRNPSGIPPLSFDNDVLQEEDNDSSNDNGEQDEQNASAAAAAALTTVSEGNGGITIDDSSTRRAADPPAIEKQPSDDTTSGTVTVMGQEADTTTAVGEHVAENDASNNDNDDDIVEQKQQKVSSTRTTDEQSPRGSSSSTQGDQPQQETSTRVVANNNNSTPTYSSSRTSQTTGSTMEQILQQFVELPTSSDCTSAAPVRTSEKHEQQEHEATGASLTTQQQENNNMMPPPNIIKAALQTEVVHNDNDHSSEQKTSPEQPQPQQQPQVSSEDEKKSEEEKNDTTTSNMMVMSSPTTTTSSDAGMPMQETVLYSSSRNGRSNHAYPHDDFVPNNDAPTTLLTTTTRSAVANISMQQQPPSSTTTVPLSEQQPPSQFHVQAMSPYGYAVSSSPYMTSTAPPPHHHHIASPAPPRVLGGGGSGSGRRKITLRLEQDAVQSPPPQRQSHVRRPSFFFRQRESSYNNMLGGTDRNSTTGVSSSSSIQHHGIDRGSLVVSWFEGTTSTELQEHVRKSLIRKMGFTKGDSVKLVDLRIIDETMDPPEEIVLSPYIPDGSHFLLRFGTKEREVLDYSTGNFATRYLNNQIASTAPDSPSAAPSPHPSTTNLLNLNEDQLAVLRAKLNGLNGSGPKREASDSAIVDSQEDELNGPDSPAPLKRVSKTATDDASRASTDFNEEEVMSMHPEDQIAARLRQLTDLLVSERRGKRERGDSLRRQEKQQVIFVMANYFVLFLSLIAIMAEIQMRAPGWLEWAERNLESVQSCATDQESLFACVSNGDFSGLIASFILWFGRSAATRRFFLFGFETPKRLWTVVYEAMVTAFCWGISYMFIRRGMNPDTRQNFISKYWKDAVYGSLAGFNASFLKAVLKNLVPQEALEDALQERHIKILSWLPSFH